MTQWCWNLFFAVSKDISGEVIRVYRAASYRNLVPKQSDSVKRVMEVDLFVERNVEASEAELTVYRREFHVNIKNHKFIKSNQQPALTTAIVFIKSPFQIIKRQNICTSWQSSDQRQHAM